jgi:hypothetical protein
MTLAFKPRQATVIVTFPSVAQVPDLRFSNSSFSAFRLQSMS